MVNRFVCQRDPARNWGRTRSTCDPIRMPIHSVTPDRPRSEGFVHGSHGRMHWSPCRPTDFGHLSGHDCNTMSAPDRRRLASPTRVTLASVLGDDDLDGAWWPHTASVARELPELIDALDERLGQIIDIGVNWSAFDGVLDLDSLTRRGLSHSRFQGTPPTRDDRYRQPSTGKSPGGAVSDYHRPGRYGAAPGRGPSDPVPATWTPRVPSRRRHRARGTGVMRAAREAREQLNLTQRAEALIDGRKR